MIKKLLSNKTIQNAGWLMGGKIIHMILSFVIGLLTTRYLGPSNYGLIGYATAYTTFFTAVCTLGIDAVIVKNFIDHPDEEGQALGTTIVLRLASSILSIGMITSSVAIVDAKESLTITVVALCSLGLIFESFDIFRQWFQSKLISKYYAIATLISYSVSSIYKLFLLISKRSVEWFALANSVDFCIVALVLFLFYKKNNGPKLSFSWHKGKELLSVSCSYILAGLMTAIYTATDKLMLKQMLGEASVGFYTLATTISCLWVFVLSAIIESMSPTIMEYYNSDKTSYIKYNKLLYAIVFYSSIFASVFICIIAPWFIKLVYGEAYLPSVPSLRIVVWCVAFSYLGVARNVWVVCEGMQRYLKYLYLGSALINVALNYLLIPILGAAGAAIASLATQVSTIFIFPALFREFRPNIKLVWEAILLKGLITKENKVAT